MSFTPSSIKYPGNGVQTDFVLPYDYLANSYVFVTVDDVLKPTVFLATNVVRILPAPPAASVVRIYRETPEAALVVWSDGMNILGAHLNKSAKQSLHIAQEAATTALEAKLTILAGVDVALAQAIAAKTSAEAALAATQALATDIVDDAEAAAAAIATSTATTAANAAVAAQMPAITTAVTNAQTAADNAQDSADAAVATVTAALSTLATAEANASASASAADGYADDAAASAAAAAGSAASAAASVVAAASSYDGFDDRMLGSKASDPTLDNDGNALVVGALYFNTTIEKIKIWTGSAWQLAFNDVAAASAISNDSGVTGSTVAAALNTLNTGKADASTTTSALALKAPLASPALTGTPTSTTAAVGTATTQVATTAFVIGQASNTLPLMDGTQANGTSNRYARMDHVHPSDTSRAPLASPGLTGTPTAPTASQGNNSTQLATTAYVDTGLGTKLPTASYTAADVLAKLLTVDGSGSGVDADRWKGATFTVSTSAPSGGADGDFWFEREA